MSEARRRQQALRYAQHQRRADAYSKLGYSVFKTVVAIWVSALLLFIAAFCGLVIWAVITN